MVETLPEFLIITVALGGLGAWLTGRAIARNWHSWPSVMAYMIPMACAERFFHFALADADLLSLPAFAIDYAWVALIASISWRATRAWQMATQYPWVYERTGLFTWRERADPEA